MPVFFIFTVTAIKDGYENYRKEKSDAEVNRQLTELVTVSPDREIRKAGFLVASWLQLNSINRDSANRELFVEIKINNFPYINNIDNSIKRENLKYRRRTSSF